jgi:uncharacterized protein YoxC
MHIAAILFAICVALFVVYLISNSGENARRKRIEKNVDEATKAREAKRAAMVVGSRHDGFTL